MTLFSNKNKAGIQKDTPISIAGARYESSSIPEKEFFCSNCQRLLQILNKDTGTGEYICMKCNVSYYPQHQEVRSTHKLITPPLAKETRGAGNSRTAEVE